MSILDCFPFITIQRPYMRYGPEKSQEQIDDLLQTVDFSKPETVKDAYKAISEMSTAAFLVDLLFYDGDHASGRKAFATLALRRCAEIANADPTLVPGDWGTALQTLSGGLTRDGQEALAENLNNTVVAGNAFAKYFTLEDRRAMAADALLTAAGERMKAGAYAQAEELYLWAQAGYTVRNLPRMAADARHSAAAAAMKAGSYSLAAGYYLQVRVAYEHLYLPREAADAGLDAAIAFLSASSIDVAQAANLKDQGIAAALDAANAYERQGLYEEAAGAYLRAANASSGESATAYYLKSAKASLLAHDVYMKKNLLRPAADAGKSAVEPFLKAQLYREAQNAADTAAQTYEQLGLGAQADEVRQVVKRGVAPARATK